MAGNSIYEQIHSNEIDTGIYRFRSTEEFELEREERKLAIKLLRRRDDILKSGLVQAHLLGAHEGRHLIALYDLPLAWLAAPAADPFLQLAADPAVYNQVRQRLLPADGWFVGQQPAPELLDGLRVGAQRLLGGEDGS